MALAVPTQAVDTATQAMTKIEQHLMTLDSPTYTAYYDGKMSYKLHGEAWEEYVANQFSSLAESDTSENIFKAVIDMYAENLVPLPRELRGFSNILVPLLSRGAAPVVVMADGTAHFPEHFEMISDGTYSIAAIFTRQLEQMQDHVVFADSSGRTRLFSKPVPDDFSAPSREGYVFVEENTGNTFFRFALDDKGFGAALAALQDRLNHSIIDTTVIAEMYARPFWYLLDVEHAPQNPFLPKAMQPGDETLDEVSVGKAQAAARIFTTSGKGPFGQLTPPTISDMVAYHDSIINKVPMVTGIAAHHFKPGEGVPPTGVALKVLSKRFNNKVARIRDDLQEELERLAALLGVKKTKEIKAELKKDEQGQPLPDDQQPASTFEYELWNTEDDLLQDALDQHGINLSQMGYPLGYIAEVVTPGVDLDDYEEEGGLPATGFDEQGVDMTAAGQVGLPATPGQVAAYGQNPGARAKAGQ